MKEPASTSPLPPPAMTVYRTIATMAAGRAIQKFILNLSRISEPQPLAAEIVVSEIMDRLSPK